jgi:carbohydrate-binding DOMON domain-containing protein
MQKFDSSVFAIPKSAKATKIGTTLVHTVDFLRTVTEDSTLDDTTNHTSRP